MNDSAMPVWGTPPSARTLSLAFVFPGLNKAGGVERSIWEAAAWFSARGHQVTFYGNTATLPAGSSVDFVMVPPSSGPSFLFPARFGPAAQAVLRSDHDLVVSFGAARLRADVLWVNSVHRAWVNAALKLERDQPLLRKPWLRFVNPRHLTLLAVERSYFRQRAALAVTVANRVADDISDLYSFPMDRCRTIHNGYDPAEFNPSRRETERAPERRRLGLPDDAVVCLFVANELPRKGIDVLLRAVAAVGDPRLHVVVAGKASPSGYAGLITELGLDDRVHYGGVYGDIGRAHAAADLFVLPTKYEAFCLAVVEAMASGLPPIVADVPGASDLVVHGESGLVLDDANDLVGLTELLRRGLDPEQRAQWSRGAVEAVQALTWDQLFAAAEALFLECVATR